MAFDTTERRRAPRIAPLSADVYSTGTAVAKESSLQGLKAQARKPVRHRFFTPTIISSTTL